MAARQCDKAIREVAQRLGLEGVRLHDLRHYVATRLIASGVDPRTVANRLGHASPTTTLSIYSHFVPEADRDAAELLGGLLDSVGHTERAMSRRGSAHEDETT